MTATVCLICRAEIHGDELCPDDRRKQRAWLDAVPHLAAELLDRRRGLTRSGGAGSGERPIPWNDGAARVLDDFEARIRLATAAGYRETATAAAARASARWTTFGGASTYGALREAVQRAEDYLTPPARWFAGTCSAQLTDDTECTRDLYARDDRGTVRCPTCRTQHDVTARRALLVDRVDDVLVTAREFCQAAPGLLRQDVREDRVRQWASRGRVTDRGTRQRLVQSSTGREHLAPINVYRFGDLADLARNIGTRKATA